MSRIFLFLMTNLAIVAVAGIVLNLVGFSGFVEQGQLNLQALLLFCFIFGMAGSFVSLLLSKWMAKRATGARVIEKPANEVEQWLVSTVETLANDAGIGMPEVAIFPATQSNAFATGWRRNSSLVAVSAGLLNNMEPDEVRAVLGHEIGHIANGDMVTLALIQGVVNTFVMFFARIIGFFVDRVLLRNERGFGIGYYVSVIFAEIVLGILASTIVFWFSRKREYRADIAGAQLAGRGNMVAALERLRKEQTAGVANQMPESMNAFGITPGFSKKMSGWFATHPPLESRIRALQDLQQ
ncbi:MAG: protease HtpX [Proteobacteria bacterium]|nr:protease HtpX [Pseudomonadota bacterium]